MSNKLTTELVLNAVSFGFVSYNILKAFHELGQEFDFKPIGEQLDFSSFSKSTKEFRDLLTNKARTFQKSYSRKNKNFRLWHIGGSESSIGYEQNLLTFHELDALTDTEVNILNNQAAVMVSSEESKQVFLNYGVTVPITYVPLGFDSEHFYQTGKKYLDDNIVVFTVAAKYEELRKNHKQLIRCWLKKYGNSPNHRLHLFIYNVHLSPEQNQQIAHHVLDGKYYSNVQFNGYLKTLGELNDAFNANNIILDASGGEGWSFGSFNSLALGKHGLISNCSAMKGWATTENAVLIEPNGKKEAVDNIFFHKGAPFNQGNIYTFSDEAVLEGLSQVEARYRSNPVNEAGLKLRDQFTWQKTAKIILENLK